MSDDVLVRALLAMASSDTPAKIASDPDVVAAVHAEWERTEQHLLNTCSTDASVDPQLDPVKNAKPFQRSLLFRKSQGIFVVEGIAAKHWRNVPVLLLMTGSVYLPKLLKVGRHSEAHVQSALAHASSMSVLLKDVNADDGSKESAGGCGEGGEGDGLYPSGDDQTLAKVGAALPRSRQANKETSQDATSNQEREGHVEGRQPEPVSKGTDRRKQNRKRKA